MIIPSGDGLGRCFSTGRAALVINREGSRENYSTNMRSYQEVGRTKFKADVVCSNASKLPMNGVRRWLGPAPAWGESRPRGGGSSRRRPGQARAKRSQRARGRDGDSPLYLGARCAARRLRLLQRGVDEHQRRVDCQGRRIRWIDAADQRLLRVLRPGVQDRRDDGETFLLTVFVLPGEVGEAILN